MSERRSPEELLKSLADYEHDDPNARPIAELTLAERDAELRSFGVDPDAIRARGAAHAHDILSKLGAPNAPSAHPPDEPHIAHAQDPAPLPAAAASRALWPWAIAGLIAAAVLARLVLGGHDMPDVPNTPSIPDAGPTRQADATSVPHEQAEKLLVAAREACARHAWAQCLGNIDAAHAADPASDQGADIRALHDAATRGLKDDKKAPRPEEKAPH